MTVMSVTPDPVARRRHLPFTVWILAGLMLLKAILILALVAGATLDRLRPLLGLTADQAMVAMINGTPGVSAILLIVVALLVLSAVGLLSRRRTGWLLAMVVTGLFVAIDIYGFFNNGANHLWQLLNIVTVFYLNQRDVREAVGVTAPPVPDPGVQA